MPLPKHLSQWQLGGDVKSWDDVVTPDEKKLVKALKEVNGEGERCPSLKEDGEFFLYCEARRKRLASGRPGEDEGLTSISPTYQAKVGPYELQIWCLGCSYEGCSDRAEEQ